MSYWETRQAQLNRAMNENEQALKKRLAAYYDAEEKRLQRQIASYYANYGKNNVIEYRQLLQKLPQSDKDLLMRDMESFAKKYPQYEHLLPVRESIYKLNRLEGLQYSVQVQQLEIGAKSEEEIRKHLEAISGMSFDSIRKDLGAGSIFNSERSDIIRTVVNTHWSKSGNFSTALWKDTTRLTKLLNDEIAAGFARGDDYAKLTRLLRHRFDVGQYEAFRLIYTEGTFVMNESKARAMADYFEYYSIVTVGDNRVCHVCEDMESQTEAEPVKMSERMAGENFPPFHPFCRCTYSVVVPDQQQWIEEYVMKHGGDPDITEEQRQQAMEILERFT